MLIMGNLKIYCGVGVSSTFLAVMRCSYQFFAVLRYSEPPNAPLYCIMPVTELVVVFTNVTKNNVAANFCSSKCYILFFPSFLCLIIKNSVSYRTYMISSFFEIAVNSSKAKRALVNIRSYTKL